jgi:hypothetical protein
MLMSVAGPMKRPGDQRLVDEDARVRVEQTAAFLAPLSRIEPMEAAMPVTTTVIGEVISCMVS